MQAFHKLKGSYQGNVKVDRTECEPTTKEFTFQVTQNLRTEIVGNIKFVWNKINVM